MANAEYYPKPCMTNLPYDLGRRIIDEIMNAPAPDFSRSDLEIAELTERVLEARRERQNAK